MTKDDTFQVEFTGLPTWADRLLERLDQDYGVLSGDIARRNFPDDEAPRWLRGTADSDNSGVPNWVDSFFRNGDRSLRQLWIEEGFLSTDPGWLEDLIRADQADVARVFLLTGNVNDYAFSPDRGYLPVVDRIKETTTDRKDWVIRYSLSNGFASPTRGSSIPEDDPTPFEELDASLSDRQEESYVESPQKALEWDLQLMEEILRQSYDGGVTLVIDNLHLLAPPDSSNVNQNVLTDALDRWSQAPWMFQSENQVILLSESPDGLTRDLTAASNHIESRQIPRPESQGDRLKFLLAVFAGTGVTPMTGTRLGGDGAVGLRFSDTFGARTPEKLRTLASRTSGLNLVGLENLLLQVKASQDKRITVEFIKDSKRDLLSRESGGLLEVSEPDASIDREEAFSHIGGLEPICSKLVDISRLMDEAGSSEVIRQSLPSGLLFLGPPGTGKTLVAQAFANACGVNFAELGNIRSMYVGESERNLTQALNLIRSLAPVVVFLDEIDQTMGQRRGQTQSGVDQRLFARLLQFMSDPELDGKVIWIGASNEPSDIDPALKRAGRFDLVLPFFRPSPEARQEIFQVHFSQRDITTTLTEDEWGTVIRETEGYTGAEIESVVKEAIWTHLTEDNDTDNIRVTYDDLETALGTYNPPAKRTDFRRMENEALLEITAVDMLTDEQQKRRKELVKKR